MKRTWYLSFALLALLISACSDDEAAEKLSFLTLEEKIVNTTLFSIYLRVQEGSGDGIVYYSIANESDQAPTVSSLKSRAGTSSVALSGGTFTSAVFQGLSPNTAYMVYAFMEVDGIAGELVSLRVTTKQ